MPSVVATSAEWASAADMPLVVEPSVLTAFRSMAVASEASSWALPMASLPAFLGLSVPAISLLIVLRMPDDRSIPPV